MAVAINKGIFIVAAKRTPFGRYGGMLKDVQPTDLLATAAKDAFKAGSVNPEIVDTVNVGQVNAIAGSSGGLTARHASLKAGIPQERPSMGLNRLCGSGFQAVINSAQDILTGVAQVSLAGGTENMSCAPFVVRNIRFGVPLGVNLEFEDILTKSSLDTYCNFTMPQTAENLAEKYGLKRGEVDEFALQSQMRWKAGQDSGAFKAEMSPVAVKVKKQEVLIDKDEHPRPETTMEGLNKLPVLFRKGGVVTAGNSSINEAFAAQTLACVKELNLDQSKLNVNGGAIAMGHPVAASGARITAHLAHELRRRGLKRGIGSACIGGGQGIALLVETV